MSKHTVLNPKVSVVKTCFPLEMNLNEQNYTTGENATSKA